MKRIILDTNFLLIPIQFKVDIFSEIQRICDFNYKIVLLEKSLDELRNIQRTVKKKDKLAIKIALSLIQSHKIETIRMGTKQELVDDCLVKYTDKDTDVVATQDINLKRRLRKKQIPLITLRQKKYLVLQ